MDKITIYKEDNINKVIHEARGLCWHEVVAVEPGVLGCTKCQEKGWGLDELSKVNPSYTTSWADYGPMITGWAWNQKWWGAFVRYLTNGHSTVDIPFWMLDCGRGSVALSQFIFFEEMVK